VEKHGDKVKKMIERDMMRLAEENKFNSLENPKDDNVIMTPSSKDEFVAPLMSSIMMIGTKEKEESKDDHRYFSFQQTLSSQMR
jgi:hypothetical protein